MSKDDLPSNNNEYARKQYWDERFSKEESYEWLAGWEDFQGVVLPMLKAGLRAKKCDARDFSILILGTGNSRLPLDLVDAGFPNVTAADYSQVVLKQMKSRTGDDYPSIQWMLADIRDMHSIRSQSVDFVLDKCTMDALEVTEGDCWDPNPTTRQDIHSMLCEVARVCSGLFVQVSFAQPHFRMHNYLELGWTAKEHRGMLQRLYRSDCFDPKCVPSVPEDHAEETRSLYGWACSKHIVESKKALPYFVYRMAPSKDWHPLLDFAKVRERVWQLPSDSKSPSTSTQGRQTSSKGSSEPENNATESENENTGDASSTSGTGGDQYFRSLRHLNIGELVKIRKAMLAKKSKKSVKKPNKMVEEESDDGGVTDLFGSTFAKPTEQKLGHEAAKRVPLRSQASDVALQLFRLATGQYALHKDVTVSSHRCSSTHSSRTTHLDHDAVWVVRHGERMDETEQGKQWIRQNASRWYDPPLTRTGQGQAVLAAKGLAHHHRIRPFQYIVCSPLTRALQTAEQISAFLDVPVFVRRGLAQCAAAIFKYGFKKCPVVSSVEEVQRVCPKMRIGKSSELHDFEETDFIDSLTKVIAEAVNGNSEKGRVLLVAHREAIRSISEWFPKGQGKIRRVPYCAVSAVSCGVEEKNDMVVSRLSHTVAAVSEDGLRDIETYLGKVERPCVYEAASSVDPANVILLKTKHR